LIPRKCEAFTSLVHAESQLRRVSEVISSSAWSGTRIETVRVPYPITGCEASVANLPLADFTAQLPSWRRQIIQIPRHLNDGTRFNKKRTRYSAPSRRTRADSPHRRIRLFSFVGTRYQSLSSREHAGWMQRKGSVFPVKKVGIGRVSSPNRGSTAAFRAYQLALTESRLAYTALPPPQSQRRLLRT
jgi:hypothetical protein